MLYTTYPLVLPWQSGWQPENAIDNLSPYSDCWEPQESYSLVSTFSRVSTCNFTHLQFSVWLKKNLFTELSRHVPFWQLHFFSFAVFSPSHLYQGGFTLNHCLSVYTYKLNSKQSIKQFIGSKQALNRT